MNVEFGSAGILCEVKLIPQEGTCTVELYSLGGSDVLTSISLDDTDMTHLESEEYLDNIHKQIFEIIEEYINIEN